MGVLVVSLWILFFIVLLRSDDHIACEFVYCFVREIHDFCMI